MSKKNKQPEIDKRDIKIPDNVIDRIADLPTGGSGDGFFISGKIQSMAREIRMFRKMMHVKDEN